MFGWVVMMGFIDWCMVFDWVVGGLIVCSSGKSGWVCVYVLFYCMIVKLLVKVLVDYRDWETKRKHTPNNFYHYCTR